MCFTLQGCSKATTIAWSHEKGTLATPEVCKDNQEQVLSLISTRSQLSVTHNGQLQSAAVKSPPPSRPPPRPPPRPACAAPPLPRPPAAPPPDGPAAPPDGRGVPHLLQTPRKAKLTFPHLRATCTVQTEKDGYGRLGALVLVRGKVVRCTDECLTWTGTRPKCKRRCFLRLTKRSNSTPFEGRNTPFALYCAARIGFGSKLSRAWFVTPSIFSEFDLITRSDRPDKDEGDE